MSLHCDRCGYEMPTRGVETAEARASLGREARISRISAIQTLRKATDCSINDAKILMNHITGEAASGQRCCYKCGFLEIDDGQACPHCRSLVLDW